MSKDFKIGMLVGLFLVVAVACWLSTRHRFSLKSRALRWQELQRTQDTLSEPTGNFADLPNALTDTKVPTGKRFHIVQKGQTLSQISSLYYNSPHKWPKIYNANKKIIKNPSKLTLGSKLLIPQ